MLTETPTKLDLEAMVSSSSRSFDEIPIWFPSSYGGFGDIMVTLNLAEGLKQEFPDKKVTVYFGKEEDYKTVQRLYPDFDPTTLETSLNGISVAQVSDIEMRKIMSRNAVGIFSPIPADNRTLAESSFMDAEFNIYLEEYDGSNRIGLPLGIERNQVYRDRNGRKHLVLPTGFQKDAVGIHIDSSLVGLHTEASVETKQTILEKAGFQWIANHIPDLFASEWGMAYYSDGKGFREDSDSYLRSLDKSLDETDNKDRPIVIFDFSRFDADYVEKCFRVRQFKEIFLEEDGSVNILEPKNSPYPQPAPNVYVVHVGPQNHATFLNFLRYSELPVQITGDSSLAEAISLNKIFIYEAPSWKGHVFPALVDLAADYLKDWRDVDRIGSLFGRDRVKEEDVTSYPEVESFYLQHRDVIHEAKKLEGECMDNGDYRTKASDLFGRILNEQKNEQSTELRRYFYQHDFAFSMAYFEREKGLDEELRTLRKRHIFGARIGIIGQEKTQRLFDNEQYQVAFHQLNRALISNLNISKNLSNLIREVTSKYQE